MSNDLIVPGLAGGPAALFDDAPIEKETIGSEISSGLGYSVVSVDGKQFKLHHAGEDYMLLDDNGGPAQTFDFVILRGGQGRSHTYYKQNYDNKRRGRPDCQSTDGIAPDDSVPPYDPETKSGKQSDRCDTCQHHEWKMQPNGKTGRACADSLRISAYPGSQKMIERAIGRRIDEPILFRVPAASMKGLVEYMALVKARFPKVASYGYLTRAKMRQDVPHPQFIYQIAEWLPPELVLEMRAIREEPTAYRILGQYPDGRSMVRAAANLAPGTQFLPKHVDTVVKEIATKTEEIEPQVPLDDIPPPKSATKPVQQELNLKPVEEAPPNMNALLSAMRSRRPSAS